MNPIAASTRWRPRPRGRRWSETDSPADDIAPKKIRVKVCCISSSRSQLPALSTARDSLHDGREGRALLLLAEPRAAQDRRPLVNHDPAVVRLTDDLEEGPRGRAWAFTQGSRSPLERRLRSSCEASVLHPLEDRLEEGLLPGEVVVERPFVVTRAPGHDRVEGGGGTAATPLVFALHEWGWTPSYAGAALFGVVLGAIVLVVVRDSPNPDHELDQIKVRALARSVRAAWRTPGTRLGLWSHFSAQFGATVFALLWGYPFLVAGQGLSPKAAGILLMLMTVTTVVSSPLIGGFVTKYPFSRSTLILGIVFSIMTVWAVVLLWPGRAPLPLLVVLVVITAVGGPGSLVGFDLARTFNPPTRLGSATGIVNVGGFLASLSTVTPHRDHPRPRGARRSEHLRRGHLPGRHVGPVPRVGRRRRPDPEVPAQDAQGAVGQRSGRLCRPAIRRDHHPLTAPRPHFWPPVRAPGDIEGFGARWVARSGVGGCGLGGLAGPLTCENADFVTYS